MAAASRWSWPRCSSWPVPWRWWSVSAPSSTRRSRRPPPGRRHPRPPSRAAPASAGTPTPRSAPRWPHGAVTPLPAADTHSPGHPRHRRLLGPAPAGPEPGPHRRRSRRWPRTRRRAGTAAPRPRASSARRCSSGTSTPPSTAPGCSSSSAPCAGDTVNVTRADHTAAVFRVDPRGRFPKDHFPTLEVYGNTDNAELRLITCGGNFDPTARSYESNIVVFASLTGGSEPPDRHDSPSHSSEGART